MEESVEEQVDYWDGFMEICCPVLTGVIWRDEFGLLNKVSGRGRGMGKGKRKKLVSLIYQ